MTGLELAGRFYRREVAPLLAGVPHAAALLGGGSEVLGYDDATSTDHDFGPRVQLFLPDDVGPAPVLRRLDRLPERFAGFPVVYPDSRGGPPRNRVEVTTAGGYFAAHLGVDPVAGMGVADWLLAPTQVLATLTAGAVFHDPAGELAARRSALRWYPDDVWRYALAAGWLRIGQEEAFVGRTGGLGDDLGSRLLAARLARELVRLAFLVERRWAPYGKWLGRAFADLALAGALRPHLSAALSATGWREREAAVCAAGEVLGAATDALDLADPVGAAAHRFFTRDVRVVGADRFPVALAAAVTDPAVRDVLDRLGYRAGVGVLPGTVDQAVDSTDVLMHPARCRALAPALGLPG